jgi:hypothetical protein
VPGGVRNGFIYRKGREEREAVPQRDTEQLLNREVRKEREEVQEQAEFAVEGRV